MMEIADDWQTAEERYLVFKDSQAISDG